MTDGSSGPASATLSVQRDNVFFGDLLVASGTLGAWNYGVSDHVGSPRLLWDATGTVTESHKYWPYGEDTTTTPPAQHLAFQTMERNDGVAQHFDHARTQQYNLGRFLTADRLPGAVPSPQSWNAYSYALGNPLKMKDSNGKWPSSFVEGLLGGRVHQNSAERVLAAFMSRADLNYVEHQQMVIDRQQASQVPHAMTDPGGNSVLGHTLANAYVKNEILSAQRFEAAGDHDHALEHFANALHTMQDATSPAHAGFAPWTHFFGGQLVHLAREDFDPGRGSQLDKATLRTWDYFTSAAPIPEDVFHGIGVDTDPRMPGPSPRFGWFNCHSEKPCDQGW